MRPRGSRRGAVDVVPAEGARRVPMRIGFEVSGVNTDRPTGMARYVQQLVPAIQARLHPGDSVMLWYKLSRLKYRRGWWRPADLPLRVYQSAFWPIRKPVDLLHGLEGFAPNWRGARTVITIQDLVVFKFEDASVSSERFRTAKWKMLTDVRRYVDAIVVISETTKQDVVSLLDVDPGKIHVTYLGVDERFVPQEAGVIERVRAKYGLPDDYLLFVGQISGRKNTERLVEAFALSGAGDGFTLVLAGSLGRQGEKTLEAIRRRHLEKNDKILGYVADSELPALYTGAKGFLFPTIYEGFGLPILEAMACGTPVLTSNVGSAPEVSGEWAINVDPYSVEEIARGMEALLKVPAGRKDDARRYAQQFTWRRCAEQTLAVYERLLQG